MIPIECVAQSYAWGKKGSQSLVAKLARNSVGNEIFQLDESKYSAELWMGTHPSGPARIMGSNATLASWLSDKPDLVGQVPDGYVNTDLPFLFKILSIRTALSIQAHPDKDLAKRLHASFPEHYKDPNHKPEMVIALTDFEAICGFRTVTGIRELLVQYPEFVHLLKLSGYDVLKDTSTNEPDVLRRLFNAYMRSKDADSQFQLDLMLERLGEEQKSRKLSDIEDLMIRLNEQFPGDNGVFCPIIMNYLKMKPGDSFFICANEPHAYISGDCAECMALSDNVVRAGLTPKFKDVDTLCNMLTYHAGTPSFLTPIRIDPYTVVYRPPGDRCAEFEVEHIKALLSVEVPLVSIPAASLLLMLDGQEAQLEFKGTSASDNVQQLIGSCRIRVGMVVFLAAGTTVTVKSEHVSAVFMRAHINLS